MEPATGDNRAARSALLEESLTAVESLDSIVENILVMNRLDTGTLTLRKSVVNVVDLVSAAADALRRQSRDTPLLIRLDEDVVALSLDFGLVVQAIGNILLNVVRHTPPGTPVEIRSEGKDRALHLTISDEGPGVPRGELPNLFGRFFRGKDAAAGCVGLGLSISKGIVDRKSVV
jgi:two-component system, OmpR family, sensor histidine kinase KdpD